MRPEDLSFGDSGLLAVVVQHHQSGQVLMVGYANREAVERALATGYAWFFSRSRQRLWQKGETSGNYLRLKAVRVDCDGDALIYLCEPVGPTCHTGEVSCFFRSLDEFPSGETEGEAAAVLFETIRRRQQSDAPESYVARLVRDGADGIARKIGEEAIEVVIAAKNGDQAELTHELADLWFHTYVLLAQQGLQPADVWAELRRRRRG
ncbi:MAG: bifunctional phosphoribosyl-AMP cyclohydrolase/phosphoribosyl-ATP diphosphatase HisIE [Chloroflexota bacterium]|nr:bifunctional phosphoribosyl-AMP cyclohydrolase/phosphoribosyl-ATP diphosphatase HisIE [Chloroflexota bacterium]